MKTVQQLVDRYLEAFPEEADKLKPLRELIRRSNETDLRRRDNWYGHITASGLVVSRKTRKVLLVRHKHLLDYLPPGGHCELGDLENSLFKEASAEMPLEAARREVMEEAHPTDLEHVAFHADSDVPIDIDTHRIPRTGDDDEHYHHDFRYLFLTSMDEGSVRVEGPDADGYAWTEIQDLDRPQLATAKAKIARLLDRELRVPRFYERVCQAIEPPDRVGAVVVTHMLPGTVEYLQALRRIADVHVVIPKPKSIVPETVDEAKRHGFDVLTVSRAELTNAATALAVLDRREGPVVLFDVGRWFAPALADMVAQRPDKVLGVVEDTENGYRRYQAVLGSGKEPRIRIPVVSVARSPLKAFEDYLVGESVVFSTDAVLRECGRLIQFLNCSVLGYGKIGRSIAQHLLARGIKPSVYDPNSVRRIAAYNHGCAIPDRREIFPNSDVVFSATGNRAADVIDFRKLKNGCFVVSVTSSDDEFDLGLVESEYQQTLYAPYVVRYTSASNYFFLVNKGNAVNFIHKAVLGDFIHLVRAEMLVAHSALVGRTVRAGLRKVAENRRQMIAGFWLSEMIDSWQQRGPSSGDPLQLQGLGEVLSDDEDGEY